jgi:predicted metal-dependent hydrolase
VQGKGCHFPLLDENLRVPDNAPASTAGELPALIDPFIKADIQLLDYAVEDGKVVERFTKEQDSTKYLRANISIDLYHLNEGTLIRDRHELQVAIQHLAERIEELEEIRSRDGGLTDKQDAEYSGLINQIGELINSASRFSAFARACLSQNGNRGWNTEILLSV